MADGAPLLQMIGIGKQFGDVVANRDVALTLQRGEVLGLLGENGAGKTTLMNILFGLYRPDEGEIRIDGSPARITTPADAIALGVGMVHQHAHVVDRHSVAENLLTSWPGQRFRLDHAGVRHRLDDIAAAYGLKLAPDRLVASLSVGEKQRLEIIKALLRGARILILDEPTSVLTPQQSEGLFKAIRALTADGVGVIYISHKLNEVRAITDRVIVMRRGEVVASLHNDGTLTNAQLAELMCGHVLNPARRAPRAPGEVRLSAHMLRPATARPDRRPFDLQLRAGEILGLAGVSGNGQVELVEALSGVAPASGTISLDGKVIDDPDPKKMIDAGLAYIPEDRLGAGLIAALPLASSLALSRVHQSPFSRRGVLDHGAIRDFAARQIAAYSIRPADASIATGLFSGGNQQKAIVARALAFDPRVLIIAQPTRGLDVSASEMVHAEIMKLRDKGCAILVVSDDLDEVFELSDRICVLYDGEIVDETDAASADRARIGLAMTAGRSAEALSARVLNEPRA
ncbi:MAG: ABC transporter ATP-binding protein [Hyphomicrobiaceae bacterium]